MDKDSLQNLLSLLKQYQSELLTRSQSADKYKVKYRTACLAHIKEIQSAVYILEQELGYIAKPIYI